MTKDTYCPDCNRLIAENQMLRTRIATLEAQLVRDTLTGLLNRLGFNEALRHEIAEANRSKRSLCVAVLDVDHFKKVNDTYGHPVGDAILEKLGTLLRKRSRESDYVARIGGEEFAIILTDTEIRGAHLLINRMRKCIEKELKVVRGGVIIRCTASFGVGELQVGQSSEDLVYEVDHALYRAKHSGRNRVVRVSKEVEFLEDAVV